jgi:hypothetical protein
VVAGELYGQAVLAKCARRFMPPIDENRIPSALLERFSASSAAERMIALLRFLGPITGGQVQAL